MSELQAITVLGTGTIGKPVARNLARSGFPVRAWNRTREKAKPLEADGVRVAETAAEAVAGADVLITVLTDGTAAEDVISDQRAADAASDGTVWIQLGTVGIAATERLAALAAEHRLVFVDSPVLGTKEPAERGELIVFASGPEQAKAVCDSIFEVIGKTTHWVGDEGAGTRMKLAVNSWLLALVEGAAETIALARPLGLDPNSLLEVLAGGPLDTPYLHLKGKMMIEHRFDPSFTLELAEKDARLVLEAAARVGLELPLVEAVHRTFERGVELGHGQEDLAATILAVEADHSEPR